jgi:hypothetical protein
MRKSDSQSCGIGAVGQQACRKLTLRVPPTPYERQTSRNPQG